MQILSFARLQRTLATHLCFTQENYLSKQIVEQDTPQTRLVTLQVNGRQAAKLTCTATAKHTFWATN